MSFSKEVKEELSKINNLSNKQEIKYEFYGYLSSKNIVEEKNIIRYSTENEYNIDRFSKIIRNIGIENFKINIKGKGFYIEIKKNYIEEEFYDWNYLKPFMRGLFMGSGSINNPEKKYHLECDTKDTELASKIVEKMQENNIKLKQRENSIYIKDGEEISKFLAFIGAVKSVLRFEQIRVQREMNNKVNRLVNCKSANLNKVLNASIEQVNAIKTLQKNGNFEKLDNDLKEIAKLRIKYPDMPLIELGQKLNPPLGKSGVNYRLKKIIGIANENK